MLKYEWMYRPIFYYISD